MGEKQVDDQVSEESEIWFDVITLSSPSQQTVCRRHDVSSSVQGGQSEADEYKVVVAAESPELTTGVVECSDMDDSNWFVDSSDEKFSDQLYSFRRLLTELKEELLDQDSGGTDDDDDKLLLATIIIATHAVLSEFGFVQFDLTSRMQVDQFHPPKTSSPNSQQQGFTMWYTLPDHLLLHHHHENNNHNKFVYLNIQISLGDFDSVDVYGSLNIQQQQQSSTGSREMYRVRLNGEVFAQYCEKVINDCMNNWKEEEEEEEEVRESWKILKDGIALPLLIDLCNEAGLALPACFASLPGDLKLKILDLLHDAIYIARMECVCSELRHLCKTTDIIRNKLKEDLTRTLFQRNYANWRAKLAWMTKVRDIKYRKKSVKNESKS